MGANATLQERVMPVEPGAEAAVHVRVRNTGHVVDHFALQVLGDAAAWAIVEPPTLSLFPGAEEVASVRFRPPRTSAVPAGDLPFGVRVVSHEDVQGGAVEEGVLRVGAFRQTAAELVPKNSRGSRSATHELAVDNNGNVPVEVFLSGVDPDAALGFTFRPPGLAIPPGRAAVARVRVTAKRTFLTGTPKPLPFQLQVAPTTGEAPIPVPGSMVQGPIISKTVRNVAVGAAAVLLAAILLWFVALKPAITTAAKDALAAQQAASVGGSQQQAHPPTPSGQQTPPPAAATPTPPGSGSGTGASFGRRLDQSGGGHNQYKVPTGVALEITDVVFQNPGGEHGTIQLQRDGVTLLVENLDNFRDLDYHFVTPISATANQTMQMTAQCPTGCPSVGIFLNGSEKPS